MAPDPIDSLPPFASSVAFNPPPETLLPSLMASIARAVATLPPDADGALVGIATEAGGNAAFVARVPGGFEVQAWVGKVWGDEITYGAAVQKVFRWGKS